ncbi:hypothetical protein D915_002391 [Fasciola hepatica]|uniref:Uncharacterized protein n=1 Tax=Fasciola hepatica TaxID=6192 RepID=A0A4E0RGL6_FASHE|nr:hypothetical protein D915_002391 [Fasciola hepatica]
MESLVLRLSETEGRLHQLRKQYDELSVRYEQSQSINLSTRQEAEQAKSEAVEMRRQLSELQPPNAQISQQTHQGDTIQKWTSRVEKSEQELADLRRNHDRMLSLCANYEEQIVQSRDLSEKKQVQIQSLLTTVTQLTGDLSTRERELNECAQRAVGAERKCEQLSVELAEAVERLDRLRDALKLAENTQANTSKRVVQLTGQYQDTIKRHENEIEKIGVQMSTYKKQTEDLTARLEMSQKQRSNFSQQVRVEKSIYVRTFHWKSAYFSIRSGGKHS